MILITGATGFLGRAVCARLATSNYVVAPGRAEADLRAPLAMPDLLRRFEPTTVIHLAYPGTDGIGTSLRTPADLAGDVLQIDLNVIRACARSPRVQHLITVGSVCSYPEHVTFPTDETQLFQGPPEAVNAPYGHAKRMQLALLDAHHRQYGLSYTALVLSNLYGPGDKSGHVVPSTIRKVLRASRTAAGIPQIEVWGDGTASREFLYVDDAAEAIVQVARGHAYNRYLNICSGEEITIRALVERTFLAAGHAEWIIHWDPSKPNGQPRRQFCNVAAAVNLGWHPHTPFAIGLPRTVEYMQRQETR